jgi:uncharacterized protein HemX
VIKINLRRVDRDRASARRLNGRRSAARSLVLVAAALGVGWGRYYSGVHGPRRADRDGSARRSACRTSSRRQQFEARRAQLQQRHAHRAVWKGGRGRYRSTT